MQRFHKKALELILRNNCCGMAEVRKDGVWPSERAIEGDPSQELLWRPVCDLVGPNVPDPLETPCLPIPFTASELAAFMLSGIGAYLPSVYGDFQDGPDEGILASFGPVGIKAKEALITAYAAYRQAERSVGTFDRALEIQAHELADMYKKENHEANKRECVFESEISNEEARERRARARASVAHLLERLDEAERVADSTFTAWRKAMVRQLLQPQDAPVVAVGATGGVMPDKAGPLVKAPAQGNSTKTRRKDSIDPVIEFAQTLCSDPKDINQVWPQMQVLANSEKAPFLASTTDGLKYHKMGKDAYFTRDALNKRLHPEKRKSPADRR